MYMILSNVYVYVPCTLYPVPCTLSPICSAQAHIIQGAPYFSNTWPQLVFPALAPPCFSSTRLALFFMQPARANAGKTSRGQHQQKQALGQVSEKQEVGQVLEK